MSNIPATLDTAVYRKLVLQLLNSLVAASGGGGGGGTTNSNVAVASDGTTRAPLKLDSAGRLIVDIGSSIQLDNITVNTGQIENKQDTTNALLTTIQSDLAGTLSTSLVGGTSNAKLQDGSGNSITSSSIGGKQRLDVNLASGGAPNTASPAYCDLMAGVDSNGTLRPFLTDSLGRQLDSIVGGTVTLGSGAANIGNVSISTVSGLGTSTLTPVYDQIVIPTSFVTGQAKIATTGTAVQLGSNALTQGVLITALSTNAASITIGTSSSVTNVVNGTGNGAILTAGSTKSIAATNTNLVWINGTAGDIISFIGS
jgi:hypothetical protein